MSRWPALVGIVILLASTSASAQSRNITVEGMRTEKRLALIIGNSAYEGANRLSNPVNDARDMTLALRSLGFDVILITDVDLKGMQRAAREFGERLKTDGVGFFYFAGHGVQVRGSNYLIPLGARITKEEEVQDEALDVNRILGVMSESRSRISIVVLDACRDNPYARSFRSSARGLAIMPAPSGTFVAYATGPGSVAADGTSRNGLFTGELLKAMRESGLTIEAVFKRVAANVRQRTQERQTPWTLSSLDGDFIFALPAASKVAAIAAPPGKTGERQAEMQVAAVRPEQRDEPREIGDVRTILRDASQAAALSVVTGSDKSSVLLELVRAQATAGDVAGAMQSASSIEARSTKDWAVAAIAEAQAKHGDASLALQTVAAIQMLDLKTAALANVAAATAKQGDRARAATIFRQALQVASTTPEADKKSVAIDKAYGLTVVASQQAASGESAAALQTARMITQPIYQAGAFAEVARSQFKGGDRQSAATMLREALQLIESAPEGWHKRFGQKTIAEALVDIGDRSSAAHVLQQAGRAAAAGPAAESTTLLSLALPVQAKAGDVDGALQTALSIPEIGSSAKNGKIAVICAVAAAVWESGDTARATKIFEDALQLATTPQKLPIPIRNVASCRATGGDVAGALKMLPLVSDEDTDKYHVLVTIAEAQVKAGDRATALATLQSALTKAAAARSRERYFNLSGALSSIAQAQAKAGDPAAAIQTFALIPAGDGIQRLAARYMSQALAETGHAKEALAWARAETSPDVKSSALLGVAEGLAKRASASQR